MQSAPIPPNESERIKALRDLAILDTESEFLYDDVTALASHICEVPISLVSLVDTDRQWFKSRHGLAATETPREYAFCSHAILGNTLFEIRDSREDIRFHDNPLVAGNPNVIFYAGIPLDTGDGLNIGTLCVIDNKPKQLNDSQKSLLRCLANQVIAILKLRRAHSEIERKNTALQAALKAKANFLATMSHEIRTPMNGIIGITNLMMDETRDPHALENLRTIANCGEILLNLLNDILDFSKMESGMLQIEQHGFSLKALIRSTFGVLSPLVAKKGLTLMLNSPSSLDWLTGDATRITQILINLIGNAIKFTAAGEILLTVQIVSSSENRIGLRFSVRDQGIGISKAQQELLFKAFTQVDASTTRKYGGTGLGLAIVKGLVESMNGKLEVESEPGFGSTFTFILEFGTTKAPIEKASDFSASIRDSEKDLGWRKPLKILVAEDDRVNQVVILNQLGRLGYNADLACDGSEVLAMMETKTYELILMDCQMPEMDGFEATTRIFEKFSAGHRPRIYALTAAVLEEEQKRCLAVGMERVLRKPLTLEDLRDAISACPSRVG